MLACAGATRASLAEAVAHTGGEPVHSSDGKSVAIKVDSGTKVSVFPYSVASELVEHNGTIVLADASSIPSKHTGVMHVLLPGRDGHPPQNVAVTGWAADVALPLLAVSQMREAGVALHACKSKGTFLDFAGMGGGIVPLSDDIIVTATLSDPAAQQRCELVASQAALATAGAAVATARHSVQESPPASPAPGADADVYDALEQRIAEEVGAQVEEALVPLMAAIYRLSRQGNGPRRA